MTDPTQPARAPAPASHAPGAHAAAPHAAAQVRSFATFIADCEEGRLHVDLTEALKDVVATLQDHVRDVGGKPKGRIDIALEFKLDDGVVEVTGDFKVKKPKASRGRSIFWATPENNLSKVNPRQHAFEFRDVSAAPEIRTVS